MSDQITLRAETGRATGSRESRRLRREGSVPGIIYGRGIDPIIVSVDHHDLMGIIQHSGSNAIITLEIDSEQHVTMPKVIERHPFRNAIRHVDFLRISLDEATTADVACRAGGRPGGSRRRRGPDPVGRYLVGVGVADGDSCLDRGRCVCAWSSAIRFASRSSPRSRVWSSSTILTR